MAIDIEQLRREIREENRRFAAFAAVTIISALSVGIAIGRFVLFHS